MWQQLLLLAVHHSDKQLWSSAWGQWWRQGRPEEHRLTWTGSQPWAAAVPPTALGKGVIKDQRAERTSWFNDPCTLQVETSQNSFLQVITCLLRTSWVFRPHHSHWALTTPCFVLILTCKNGSPPYVQEAARTPLNLCFGSLKVLLVPLTSTHNINFILLACQTELTFLGHLRQHLTSGEFMLALPQPSQDPPDHWSCLQFAPSP